MVTGRVLLSGDKREPKRNQISPFGDQAEYFDVAMCLRRGHGAVAAGVWRQYAEILRWGRGIACNVLGVLDISKLAQVVRAGVMMSVGTCSINRHYVFAVCRDTMSMVVVSW